MKILSLLLSVLLLLSFSACGDTSSDSDNSSASSIKDTDITLDEETIKNYIDFNSFEMTLVNPWNHLAEDFEPELSEIDKDFCSSKLYFANSALDDLLRLCKAAKDAGMTLTIISAWDNTAAAGTSEHALGLSVDFNFAEDSFRNTREYQWLITNCSKFGFILRYDVDTVSKTGHPAEPYHFRYVGVQNAKIIEASNLCLEEFIEKYSPFE